MISVIIPAHNEELYLGKLLSDLKKQRHNAFEVIVSDDFSSDKTVLTAKKSKLRMLKVIEHKSLNAAAARNIGAGRAKGEVLVFLDADTRVHDVDFVGKVADAFSNEAVNACSVAIMVNPDEATFLDLVFQKFFNWNVMLFTSLGLFASRGECQIVRKEIFRKAGGYNENISVAEDVELFKRIRKISMTKFLNNIIIYESPRRYRKEGYLRTVCKWCYNGVYALVFGTSPTKVWKAVR